MKPRYLSDLFSDEEYIQLTSEDEIPRLRKPPQLCDWDIPPRSTVICDLLDHYPDYSYDQLAVMVSNVFGTSHRDEIEFVDTIESAESIISIDDAGIVKL